MEEKKEFYKVRSYTSCLSEGVKLFAPNILTLFRSLWPGLLVASLLTALGGLVTLPVAFRMIFSWMDPSVMPYISVVAAALSIGILIFWASLAGALPYAQLLLLTRSYARQGVLPAGTCRGCFRKEVWRVAGCALLATLAGWLVCGGLLGLWHVGVGLAWWTFFMEPIVVLGLLIPYICWVHSLLLYETGMRPSPAVLLRSVYQNWGSWAAVTGVGGFCVGLVGLLFSLPPAILMMAEVQAYVSELGGDMTDMPAAFGFMKILMLAVSSLLVFFLSMIPSLISSFMAASIRQKEIERQRYEEEQQLLQD